MVLIIAPPSSAFSSFPLPSMLYALDRPDAPLKSRLIGTLVYFIADRADVSCALGVMGAAAAFVPGLCGDGAGPGRRRCGPNIAGSG